MSDGHSGNDGPEAILSERAYKPGENLEILEDARRGDVMDQGVGISF